MSWELELSEPIRELETEYPMLNISLLSVSPNVHLSPKELWTAGLTENFTLAKCVGIGVGLVRWKLGQLERIAPLSILLACRVSFHQDTTISRSLGSCDFIGLWEGREWHHEKKTTWPLARQTGQWKVNASFFWMLEIWINTRLVECALRQLFWRK